MKLDVKKFINTSLSKAFNNATKKMNCNAFAQLVPEYTLSFFSSYLRQQLNLDKQWEIAIPGLS